MFSIIRNIIDYLTSVANSKRKASVVCILARVGKFTLPMRQRFPEIPMHNKVKQKKKKRKKNRWAKYFIVPLKMLLSYYCTLKTNWDV